MASTSRHHPPRDLPLERAPSNLWNSLSVKLRAILLFAGFLFSYYYLFARHQKSDRRSKKMKEVQKDLEDILRKANESGFMGQNLSEAVLPEVFREGEEVNFFSNETNSEPATKGDDSTSVSKDEVVDKAIERKDSGSSHDKRSKENRKTTRTGSEKTLENKPRDKKVPTRKASSIRKEKQKKSKKKKKKKKKKKRKKRKTGDKSQSPHVRAETVSKESNVSDVDQTPSGAISSSTIHEATPSPSKSPASNVTEEVKETNKRTESIAANDPEPESQEAKLNESSAKSESNKNISRPVSATSKNVPEFNATNSGIAEATKPGRTVALIPEGMSHSAVTEASGKGEVPATAVSQANSKQTRMPVQFEGLVGTKVSNDSTPILNWNPEAIMNESTPEQIFGLGDRHDHIVAYKPLCVDTESEEGIIFEGETVCGGFNRTEAWMTQYCNVMKSATRKEHLLKVQSERKNKEWLERNAKSIHWVPELTVLQVLERNCGNIAHYAGRALLLQHIIENAGSYVAPPSDLINILVLPTFHVMKRFLYPQNYAHWHERLLQALVAPAEMRIGDLGNFLYRSSKRRGPNEPLVQLLHNFSIAQSPFAAKKYVCFKRVVIPGYLKGRFFVNDVDYPSSQPSLQSDETAAPNIPRDSLRMRERVSALVDQSSAFRVMEKEVILIDRQGKRRIFDEAKKAEIMKAFEDVASKHGYKFRVISFEKMSFDEQYKAVSSVAIAIGIHGANLVNAMFMPPLAVLIELFPYGFVHEMYRNGGNAGLKYFSYQMSTGIPFKGKNVYRSPAQCVKLNDKCKVHYRDSILQVTDTDIANMGKVLADAIAWCNKLPTSSKYSAEPARKRRRLLRELIDVVRRRRHRPRSLTWG